MNSLGDLLSQQIVIVGIVLASLGVAFSMLAKRIARAIRKKSEISPTDPVMLVFKAFGLVCILVALILIMVAVKK